MFKSTGGFITRIIDFFYPPFSRYFSVSLFRYAVTGVSNLVLDWVLYFLVYQFVLHKQMLHLGIVTFSSHIATKFIVFPNKVLFNVRLNSGRDKPLNSSANYIFK